MRYRGAAKAAAGLMVVAALTACASTERFAATQPEQAAASPPPPPVPPPPPPIDLAGKWKLTLAGGGCFMTLGDNAGAAGGSVAPAGGCPGNFFTSRKWSFEHDMLIIRDHKGEVLAELAFANGHFAGNATNGAAVSLAR